MSVMLSKNAENEVIRKKLSRLGVDYHYFKENRIENLGLKTNDWLYLIHFEQNANWSKLRVALAQANRHYIAYGENLNSEKVVQAMRDGAYDVLDLADPDSRWKKAFDKAQSAQKLWLQLYIKNPCCEKNKLIGQSPAIKALCRTLSRVGPTDASVLITGESGVGKECAARALHQAGPFIAVNCAAIPKDLMEAELFGSVKGAYTGSVAERHGLVQEADGGTLFLDEIGELDLSLQPKLLRFLETYRARPLGGTKEYKTSVRILSATNRDLQKMSTEDKFRLDLYFRLSEVTVRVPPLRERVTDIPLLAQSFLRETCERFGKNFEAIETELLTQWQSYSWPGNVRELKHVIEQLVIFYDGPILREGWWRVPEAIAQSSPERIPEDWPTPPKRQQGPTPIIERFQNTQNTSQQPANSVTLLNRKQKFSLAKHLLEESGDDYSWVASQLGVHPTTLYRWRMKHRL